MSYTLGRGTGPLAGIKVVEIAGIGPGPHACMLLADLGADVIRIEQPGGQLLTGGSHDLLNRGRPVLLRPEPCGNRICMEEPGPRGSKRTRGTVVDRVFPFAEVREALRYLESAAHFGKICVRA